MARLLLAALILPTCAWAWTQTEWCALMRETPQGPIVIAPLQNGILFYPPPGLIPNDTWTTVVIGNRIWRELVVAGAIDLEGGIEPFLARNWMTVHVDAEQVLGFNLLGSSKAWKRLWDCKAFVDGGGWILLASEITADTDDAIIGEIRHRRPAGLLLDSPGGLAEEAQRIGRAVRAAKMETKVQADGRCFSECTFILAAGTPRTLEPGARVGIPESLITRGLGVFLSDQESIVDSASYFNAMDVDGGRLAVLATSVETENLRIFTQKELRDTGLVSTAAAKTTRSPPIARTFSDTGRNSWLLLAGVLGAGIIAWGLTRLWERSRISKHPAQKPSTPPRDFPIDP